MSNMFSDVKKELDNILYYGYYDAEAVDVITGTHFDEDAYLTALLSMRNPTEAEAYWLKSQFMYSTTAKNTKTVLKNKKIKLAKYSHSSTSISKECPQWSEVIKYVGGYSELAKSGIKKNTYEDLFTLSHNYDLVTFVEQGKCVISSKYSGNDKAFEYHKIDKEKSDKIIGEYFIEELNYDILSGKVEPVVIVKAGDLSFSFNLYDKEPRTKTSLKESFQNYDATINTMFDDLLMDIFEEEKRIDEEKEREEKRIAEEKRKIEAEENRRRKIKKQKENDLMILFEIRPDLKSIFELSGKFLTGEELVIAKKSVQKLWELKWQEGAFKVSGYLHDLYEDLDKSNNLHNFNFNIALLLNDHELISNMRNTANRRGMREEIEIRREKFKKKQMLRNFKIFMGAITN